MSDLISRKALQKKAFQYETNGKRSAFVVLLSDIENAKAVDAEPVVHGQWDEERFAFCNVCSNCRLVIDRTSIKMHSGKFNYCPNCGAKMK